MVVRQRARLGTRKGGWTMPPLPRKPCANALCGAIVPVGVIYCERCAGNRPPAPCRGGCGALVRFPETYCPRCAAKYTRQVELRRERGTTLDRGYGGRWRKIRAVKLGRTPLCERCEAGGKLRLACQVHHIDHDAHNNADENLMSVCIPCHAEMGR